MLLFLMIIDWGWRGDERENRWRAVFQVSVAHVPVMWKTICWAPSAQSTAPFTWHFISRVVFASPALPTRFPHCTRPFKHKWVCHIQLPREFDDGRWVLLPFHFHILNGGENCSVLDTRWNERGRKKEIQEVPVKYRLLYICMLYGWLYL